MTKTQLKERLIQNAIIASRGGKGGGNKNQLLHEYLSAFYQQVPVDDLDGWKAEKLSRVAKSMCDWGLERAQGQLKVRAFNPDLKRDGWHAPHTVVQIVNDDMPFIIDSISSEMTAQGLGIDVLFHPILSVRREDGKMEAVHSGRGGIAAKKGDIVESTVFIQLEQMLTSDGCRKLVAALERTLGEVRAATGDWQKMLAKAKLAAAFHDGFHRHHDKHDVTEAQDFLVYMKENNFTFLGYREYAFSSDSGKTRSAVVAGTELGILRSGRELEFGQGEDSPELGALKRARWPVMVSKLVGHEANVHRRVPLDALIVKILDEKGHLTGMHLFVGLFTSSTYSCRTSEIPMVRQKVSETIDRAGFMRGSHDYKSLEHILEKMPRDELFQVSSENLQTLALGILRLQVKQRVALFTHLDPIGQHMSCLLYVPRDRYNTKFRVQAARILETALGGRLASWFTTLDDSLLARLLVTIRVEDGAEGFDHHAVEARLIELAHEWDERLKRVLIDVYGKIKGSELAFTYGRAFPGSYHETIEIGNAVHDIRQLEAMAHNEVKDDISVEFYRLNESPPGEFRLKVYHEGGPVPLSDILPLLDNMGFKSLSEMPFEVRPHGSKLAYWIHDFVLKGPDVDIEKVKENLEDAFIHAWNRRTENDGLNQLVLLANLSWREVRMLRTYSGYMRQARMPYSRSYIEQTLNAYPHIARALVDMFMSMHDPKAGAKAQEKGRLIGEKIEEMLQDVHKLDHDRILRAMRGMIAKTLRTSYFQSGIDGEPKNYLAIKLDSKNIPEVPLPRPHVEIYLYSTRVEGIHLRGGDIARGGIRWSDRHEDFRTEILSLMKAQMVKNTVIVPVGAKGGFIVKQPPQEGGRPAYLAEGVECYKIFVQALLDLTDNNVKGKQVRPKNVLCHDEFDPYLVVAADKGTATFSDIANELSVKAKFWLGDAFASGGSSGYDHKKMGITARGGWESVKRHFREIGMDIQKEPFTLIGIGDMGGDVFGNGMLLSRQMKLVAAFNHVHIFIDPNPDIASSFAERQRLFKNRLGWDGYDKDKISAGGGVFDRSAKSIKLSANIRRVLEIEDEVLTPDELIKAILKARVDLLWLGGIGTYIKAQRQSHADADDRANDNVRIDADELRVSVVGEGANLGVTQLARVEFAQRGGRINTDFIDNSAGVDCSDHEVNIKILLNDVMSRGKMTLAQRDKLLENMTKEVAKHVLRDNYLQTQSLTMQLHLAREHLGLHAQLMRHLEKENLIRRSLEGLPDEENINRLQKEGVGLSRPELCVLMSWSKIDLYNQVLKSDVPDIPMMETLLFDYFPEPLHKHKTEIEGHKLRREIIATQLVNTIVNRMGAVFVQSRMAKTGASAADVVKAFAVVMQVYDLPAMWKSIEDLDNKVSAAVQLQAMAELFKQVKRVVTWHLRFGGHLDIASEIKAFKPGIEFLRKSIRGMVTPDVRADVEEMEREMIGSGMPEQIASEIYTLGLLASASDIISIAHRTEREIKAIADVYFGVGETMGIDWLRLQADDVTPANSWQARVKGGLMDNFYIHQAALASTIISAAKKKDKLDRALVAKWFAEKGDQADKIIQLVHELKGQPKVDLEMLVMADQRIGQLVYMAG